MSLGCSTARYSLAVWPQVNLTYVHLGCLVCKVEFLSSLLSDRTKVRKPTCNEPSALLSLEFEAFPRLYHSWSLLERAIRIRWKNGCDVLAGQGRAPDQPERQSTVSGWVPGASEPSPAKLGEVNLRHPCMTVHEVLINNKTHLSLDLPGFYAGTTYCVSMINRVIAQCGWSQPPGYLITCQPKASGLFFLFCLSHLKTAMYSLLHPKIHCEQPNFY